jgi:hypothetical protein
MSLFENENSDNDILCPENRVVSQALNTYKYKKKNLHLKNLDNAKTEKIRI